MKQDVKRLYVDLLKIDKGTRFMVCGCNECKKEGGTVIKREYGGHHVASYHFKRKDVR